MLTNNGTESLTQEYSRGIEPARRGLGTPPEAHVLPMLVNDYVKLSVAVKYRFKDQVHCYY